MTEIQNALVEHLKVLDSFGKFPPGYNYKSMYDFVLDRGEFFDAQTPLTPEEEKIVRAAKKSRKFQMKQCFYNSQKLLLEDSSGQLKYAEGWAHSGIIPVHHGWVHINGKVVDVTWTNRESRLIAPPEGFTYFGVSFDSKLVIERMLSSGVACSVIDDYENNWPVLKWPRKN